MTTSVNTLPTTRFPSVYCTELIVTPSTTRMKWDVNKKNANILIQGNIDNAKTTVVGIEQGILGQTPLIIGTTIKNWYYTVNLTTTLHIGVVLSSQSLTSINGATIDKLMAVIEGDTIRFALTVNSLVITRNKGDRLELSTVTYNMTPYVGQTLYPWASTTVTQAMSVRITEDFDFPIIVGSDGSANLGGLVVTDGGSEFKSVTLNNGSGTTKLQTGATSNYTLTLPVDDGLPGQTLVTDGTGITSWVNTATFDQGLNTTDDVTFNDLILTGTLTVQGTTTLVETAELAITDNIIVLNKDEIGAGVTLGASGIEIERGSLANVRFLFDEATDKWTLGTAGGIGTTRFIIPEIADVTQTQGAIPGYDVSGRLAEAEGLTAAEVNQLQNIDTQTISNVQWGHVSTMDQDVAATSNVTFNDVTINGGISLSTGGGLAESVSAVLTADPAPIADGITLFDADAASRTATLPDNAVSTGKTFTIVLTTKTGAFTLTINRAGTDTIEGVLTSMVLDTADQNIKFKSLGTGDWIIA